MNRGDKQERVIWTMGILKGRYFEMTAFNWSHHFWIECNMGFLLSLPKRWQRPVSSEKVIVRRMACVVRMSEQEFWLINCWVFFPLLEPYMLSSWTSIPSFTIRDGLRQSRLRSEYWHTCFESKMASAPTEIPLAFLTLIEREPLKRTANLPSRGNPTGDFSCSEMLNYLSSVCASIQCPQLFYPLLLWESSSRYSFKNTSDVIAI